MASGHQGEGAEATDSEQAELERLAAEFPSSGAQHEWFPVDSFFPEVLQSLASHQAGEGLAQGPSAGQQVDLSPLPILSASPAEGTLTASSAATTVTTAAAATAAPAAGSVAGAFDPLQYTLPSAPAGGMFAAGATHAARTTRATRVTRSASAAHEGCVHGAQAPLPPRYPAQLPPLAPSSLFGSGAHLPTSLAPVPEAGPSSSGATASPGTGGEQREVLGGSSPEAEDQPSKRRRRTDRSAELNRAAQVRLRHPECDCVGGHLHMRQQFAYWCNADVMSLQNISGIVLMGRWLHISAHARNA